MAGFDTSKLFSLGEKLLYFVLILVIVNGIIIAVSAVISSLNIVQWSDAPAGPTENPLYESKINQSADFVSGKPVYVYDLDSNGDIQLSDAYEEYVQDKADAKALQETILNLMNIILGGLFTLALVLEIFGFNLAGMMNKGKSRKQTV